MTDERKDAINDSNCESQASPLASCPSARQPACPSASPRLEPHPPQPPWPCRQPPQLHRATPPWLPVPLPPALARSPRPPSLRARTPLSSPALLLTSRSTLVVPSLPFLPWLPTCKFPLINDDNVKGE